MTIIHIMSTILKSKSIYYNDVNLIAKPAGVKSRSEIMMPSDRIMVSPMSSIVGKKFALEALRLGLTINLHKFCDVHKQIELYNVLINAYPDKVNNIFVSVGLNDRGRVEVLRQNGVKQYLIDCANGYLSALPTLINELYKFTGATKIMTGNVMSAEGVELYYKNLNPSVKKSCQVLLRTGIGGGSPCQTACSFRVESDADRLDRRLWPLAGHGRFRPGKAVETGSGGWHDSLAAGGVGKRGAPERKRRPTGGKRRPARRIDRFAAGGTE